MTLNTLFRQVPLPDIIDTNSENLIQTFVDFLEYNKVQLSNYSFEEGGLV